MRSVRAEHRGSLLLAGALLATAGLTGCQSGDEPYVAPRPTASRDVVEPAAAARTLDRFAGALRQQDADAAAALGAEGAGQDLLRDVAETVTALDLSGVTFRYVTEAGPVAPDGTWTATVAVTWRVAGFEPTAARAEVEFDFADGGEHIRSIGGGVGRSPVWLVGPAEVRRTGDVAVLVSAGALPIGPLVAGAEAALAAASDVLGGPRGRLVVEVPADGSALHAALGLAPGSYDAVAALTTSADGANVPGTPIHVFLNPDVFAGLEPTAAQVVLSHEAVHALTAAPTETSVEAWLLEGFADYVALRDVDLPLSRTAGQVIAQVRQEGVPDTLPTRVDLDSQAQHLGAAYEAAWLVCVTLAERGGEDALVALYDAVLDGADLESELMDRFDWTIPALTRAWQDVLTSISAADG